MILIVDNGEAYSAHEIDFVGVVDGILDDETIEDLAKRYGVSARWARTRISARPTSLATPSSSRWQSPPSDACSRR